MTEAAETLVIDWEQVLGASGVVWRGGDKVTL